MPQRGEEGTWFLIEVDFVEFYLVATRRGEPCC